MMAMTATERMILPQQGLLQGDGANGGLDGCFWQIGEYAEKSFFRIEVCFYHA